MSSRILVIDDEASILKMMDLVLTGAGHAVTTALSGREGLSLYGNGANFDLVITEYKLPDITGLEVEQQILSIQPAAKIILISGFGGIHTALEAMNRGASDFLRKPFAPDCLRDAVEAALNGHPKLSPVATVCKEFSRQNVNGFSFELSELQVDESNDNLVFTFEIHRGTDSPRFVRVLLSAVTQEVIKAYMDVDEIPSEPQFYQKLCEETLAHYLISHGAVPSTAVIDIQELDSKQKQWIDSMMTVAVAG